MTAKLSNTTQEKFVVGAGKESRTFISNGWSPLKAAKNLPSIGKCFATPISMLIGAGDEDGFKEAIPQALYMLFEQLEENDIEELFTTILQNVYTDNGTRIIDIETDLYNLDELLELVSKVLKQHYGCLISGKGFTSLFQMMVPLNRLVTA